jgi:hypothetical protein
LQDAIFQRSRLRLIALICASLSVKTHGCQFARYIQAERHEGFDLVDVNARWRTGTNAAANLASNADTYGAAHFRGGFGGWRAYRFARARSFADIVDAVFKAAAKAAGLGGRRAFAGVAGFAVLGGVAAAVFTGFAAALVTVGAVSGFAGLGSGFVCDFSTGFSIFMTGVGAGGGSAGAVSPEAGGADSS